MKKSKVVRISRQSSPIQIMIDQTQLQNGEYFTCLDSRITNDSGCTQQIQPRTIKAKVALNKKKALFTSKLRLNLRKKIVKCDIWSIALYAVETWTLQKEDQKFLEGFEMWCWRIQKISWANCVKNEEVLQSQERKG